MRVISCSLLALLACGGSRPDAATGPASPADPTAAEAPPADVAPPAPTTSQRIEAACQQLVAVDQRDRCGFGVATAAECAGDLANELDGLPEPESAIYLRAFDCMASVDSCSGQEQCFVQASNELDALQGTAGAPPPPRTDLPCNRADEFGPAQVSAEEYAARHGAGVTRLPDLTTSAEQPVEVCGVLAQRDFLVAAECADGSHPFASRDEVAEARAGNVGPGGRCGAIVDLYQVSCPEATYEVYMDLYYCQAGQSI